MNDTEFGRKVAKELRRGRDMSTLVFIRLAESEAFDETTMKAHIDEFPAWVAGISVTAGALYTHGGKLYRTVQSHKTQSDWPPDKTPALWTAVGDRSVEFPAWQQPLGAHDAYNIGDKVSFGGTNWHSTAAANVWQPGVYGWEAL